MVHGHSYVDKLKYEKPLASIKRSLVVILASLQRSDIYLISIE